MNMPITDINRRKIENHTFAVLNAEPAVTMRQQINSSVMAHCVDSHTVLDKHFSLQHGSHKDVKQYVVYFHHIMAFFADGSHCGLQTPKQFVAFLGTKESPQSIVLKEHNLHLELVLSEPAQQDTFGADATIKFPAQGAFSAACGDDYFLE